MRGRSCTGYGNAKRRAPAEGIWRGQVDEGGFGGLLFVAGCSGGVMAASVCGAGGSFSWTGAMRRSGGAAG
jgi:hypothetical protein